MSDKKPGSVFFDDSVDSRAPAPGIPQPVSSGDIIGANVTLGYQDMAGQPLQAKIDAYTPLINELDKRDTRSWAEKVFGPQYILGVRGGLPINTNKVWGDIAAIRAKEPGFLKDIPAANDEQFDAWVKSGEKAKRTQAQDIVRRQQGFGQNALGFGAGVATGLVDPINLGGMLATGGLAGGAKTLLGSMAREAAINSAIEVAELPAISSNRAQFGEQMTPLDMVADVGMAAAGGALLPVAGKLGKAVAAPALEPIGRAIDPLFDPMRQRAAERALGIADLPAATDADVLSAFTKRFPPETRTPDAQAAINVLERETDVRGASPYAETPGALDANAERLGAASDVLSQPAAAGKVPPAPRVPSRTTPQLTQDNIIRFVLNDLEGGAKVVPFSQADGGTTKYGVAKKFNPDVDVANITEADAMKIARQRYWLPEFNTVDPRVAAIAFDANWISSPTLARKIIREAGSDVNKALEIYRARLMEIADTVPGKGKFRKGWNNRVNKLGHYLGDAEPSAVRLAPEQFNGDDVAYRAAQEQLNTDELRLADDTPREPDPVREYVDRQLAGDDLTTSSDRQFAATNAPDIAAEVSRRAELGTDAHPPMLAQGGDTPGALASATREPSDASLAMAVRAYVERTQESLNPKVIAERLEVSPAAARNALQAVAALPDVVLERRPNGTFSRARESTPRDLLGFLADRGGIRDTEGHSLVKGRNISRIAPTGGVLIRKAGMSLDHAREIAAEAGYFHHLDPSSAAENTTVDDFLQLLEGAQHGGHYSIEDLHTAEAIAHSREVSANFNNARAMVDAHMADYGFDLNASERMRAADLIASEGLTSREAMSRVIMSDIVDILDAAAEQGDNAIYGELARELGFFHGEDPFDLGQGGEGSRVADRPPQTSEPSASELGGARADEREAEGLNGPPPLDPKQTGFDEPLGPDAERVADDGIHDVRAALDMGVAADPAIAERQKQQAALKAGSPLQSIADQADTMGLSLFDHVDQPGLNVEIDGVEMTAREAIEHIDREETAIKATKDCL